MSFATRGFSNPRNLRRQDFVGPGDRNLSVSKDLLNMASIGKLFLYFYMLKFYMKCFIRKM